MKPAQTILVGAICAILSSGAVSMASYLNPEGAPSYLAESASDAPKVRFAARIAGARDRVMELVAQTARAYGVDPRVALKIVKLESGFNARAVGPRTRHGHAVGLGQLLPSSAEALEPGSSRHLFDPVVNARVSVKHMLRCMHAGARSGDEIARCHVAGWAGWNRRLSRGAERYKRQYVAMYRAQAVPDQSGWLARGSGSLNVASLW